MTGKVYVDVPTVTGVGLAFTVEASSKMGRRLTKITIKKRKEV
jgi:hypothetical protein